MLIPFSALKKYNIPIKGVVQVGAHFAEEHDVYVQEGINKMVYIEPCKDAISELIKRVSNGATVGMFMASPNDSLGIDTNGIRIFMCACSNEEGEMEMYVSHNNQGQSNSLLKPQLHLKQHPEVIFTDKEKVKVVTLDSLPFNREDFNLLMLDVQGAELMVLQGATKTLQYIDIIYTEVNRAMTYEDCPHVTELDDFLEFYDFERKETIWASSNLSWGDAIYIRRGLL